MRFIKFKEYCDWEGETWYSWLQIDGNEDELDNFSAALDAAQEGETFDLEFELLHDDVLEEAFVDCLVEHGNSSTYTQTHSKVTGKFTSPTVSDILGQGIYKGKIDKFFTKD